MAIFIVDLNQLPSMVKFEKKLTLKGTCT